MAKKKEDKKLQTLDEKFPKPRSAQGRLTDDLIEEICTYIEMGNHESVAVAAAGIPWGLYQTWRAQGEDSEEGLPHKLVFLVDVSTGRNEVYATATLTKHMPRDWRAALAYLERRFPDRWSKINKQERTGKDGGPLEVNLTDVTEQRRAEEAEIEELEAWERAQGFHAAEVREVLEE